LAFGKKTSSDLLHVFILLNKWLSPIQCTILSLDSYFTVETAVTLGFDDEAVSNMLTLAKNYGEEEFD